MPRRKIVVDRAMRLIRCTIDPQINPEARIHHVNSTIIVQVCEFLTLTRYVMLVWQV